MWETDGCRNRAEANRTKSNRIEEQSKAEDQQTGGTVWCGSQSRKSSRTEAIKTTGDVRAPCLHGTSIHMHGVQLEYVVCLSRAAQCAAVWCMYGRCMACYVWVYFLGTVL